MPVLKLSRTGEATKAADGPTLLQGSRPVRSYLDSLVETFYVWELRSIRQNRMFMSVSDQRCASETVLY